MLDCKLLKQRLACAFTH